MKNNNEDQLHWSEEKEVIKTNRPLVLLLSLMKKLPAAFVFVLIYPISFFILSFQKGLGTRAVIIRRYCVRIPVVFLQKG